ncbi:hypothetical protein M1D72_13790 [Vibrio sp. AK197]
MSIKNVVLCLALLAPLHAGAEDLETLRQQAEQNNTQAQFELAQRYANDESALPDASYWYTQAAQNGHLQASLALAKLSLNTSNNMEFSSSFYWLLKSAVTGNTQAQIAIAELYLSPEGQTIASESLAQAWYQLAADTDEQAANVYAQLLEQQFNQQRAKQLAAINEREHSIEESTQSSTNANQISPSHGWMLYTIIALAAALAIILLLLVKKRFTHQKDQASANYVEQLQAHIDQQNATIKQQKRQLETLFRQFKKLEATPQPPKTETRDHKLGLAASMFGYRLANLPDEKQLKTRYKQLCKIYHPDLKGSDEEMKRLNSALKILVAHVNK